MSNPGKSRHWGAPRGASFMHTVPPLGLGEQYEDLWLLTTLNTALGRRGIHVKSAGGGALSTADGMVIGLDGLIRQLHLAPRDHWDAVVEHFANDVAASREDADAPLDITDPQAPLYARVVPGRSLGSPAGPIPSYAQDLGGDLWAVAVVRRPGRTLMLMADDALDEAGGWEAVRPRALDNIRELGLPELSTISKDDRPESTVFMLESEDTFGSARLLILDELVERITLGQPTPWGRLVAVPHRHMMLVHLVVGDGLDEALGVMSWMARDEHARELGPCSPLVYYQDPGGMLETVTVLRGGSARVSPGPRLATMLRRLNVHLEAS